MMNGKKVAIVLSCYDRVDDLLAHLDIIRFNPYNPRVIVVWLHEDDPPELPVWADLIRLPSPGFTSGPLLSLTRGLKRAADFGMDYVVFRNGDDWLFDHELAQSWLYEVDSKGKLAAGYNWFTVGSFRDITMNENILNVRHFMPTVDEAEKYFLSSDQTYNCEYKMAWWMRKAIPDIESQFFRLPDREQEPGVGWEVKDIPMIYEKRNEPVPAEVMANLVHNHRFFNRKWKMIGCHDIASRYFYWLQLRSTVPYAEKLERCEHFNRFLHAATKKLPWNKQEMNYSRITRTMRPKPVMTEKSMPRKLYWLKSSAHQSDTN
jgi:hypothetical protein